MVSGSETWGEAMLKKPYTLKQLAYAVQKELELV